MATATGGPATASVRLVPLSALRLAKGRVDGIVPSTFAFAVAPRFALISYRQVDVGLGGGQRLSAKDVLCACNAADRQGATHVWLDVLCGLVAGEAYVHENFLATLRDSLHHAAAIVVVGDGGCTERLGPPTAAAPLGRADVLRAALGRAWRGGGEGGAVGVSDYLCRLWTRYELRAALQQRKLHYASPRHREALLRGVGVGLRSRLFWTDVVAEIPAPYHGWPRAVKALDVLSLLVVYLCLLLLCVTLAALRSPATYISDESALDGQGAASASNVVLVAFKVVAIVLPLVLGPIGFRAFFLRVFSVELREAAQVHRLRRALRDDRRAEAAQLADSDPYEMPCFEPCDRLIVAELTGKKADRAARRPHAALASARAAVDAQGSAPMRLSVIVDAQGSKPPRAGGAGGGAPADPASPAVAFWANVLVQGLRARGGQSAFTESGARVLRSLLEEAVAAGACEWARELLNRDAQPPAQPAPRTALTAGAGPDGGAAHAADAAARPAAAEAASSLAVRARLAWAGARLPLRLLEDAGASVTCDLALGYATLAVAGAGALELDRRADRPLWRVSRVTRARRSAARTLEDARHFSSLLMDLCFWVLAFVACLSISDDYLDKAYRLYSTSFSYAIVRPVLDDVMVPAIALWGASALASLALALMPTAVARALGGRGRELRSLRYHGWGCWLLLVEVDLLVVYAQRYFHAEGGAPRGSALDRIAKGEQGSADVYFQTFWDSLPALSARAVLFFFLFVPAHAVEPLRLLACAPRWLLRTAEGGAALALTALNPHHTGQPLSMADELVDWAIADAHLPPPPPPPPRADPRDVARGAARWATDRLRPEAARRTRRRERRATVQSMAEAERADGGGGGGSERELDDGLWGGASLFKA